MTADQVLPPWEFDLADPALAPRMHEVFTELRNGCPVVHSPRHGGFWAVLSHAAVQQVSSDPQTFSSAHGISIPLFSLGVKHPPADFDPPAHTEYRRIIQRHFTRHAVARYEPMIRGLAQARITEIASQEHADLVPELALYVPPVAIAAILGLPPEDGHKLVAWTNALFAGAASGDEAAHLRTAREFEEYLAGHVDQHAGDTDTVTGSIIGGQIDGRPLTRDEKVGMVLLLVVAGHETSANGISAMLHSLAVVDGLRERVSQDPALIPGMIEECLRLESPVIAMARTVMRDTQVGPQPLTAGEKVLFVLSAANRDPAQFDHPDEFVCPREDGSSLTFGYGIHRCVGEHLAQLEMRIVAEEVLRLMPLYRLAGGYQPQWVAGRMVRGLSSLPVEIAAG
jgi:cytochrome P450